MNLSKKPGQVFGQLEIISLLPGRDDCGRRRYSCRCVCGKEVVRGIRTLRKDDRHISCGCHLQRRRRMVTDTTKQCKACGEVKDISQFGKLGHSSRGHDRKYYTSRCKPCSAEYNRQRLYGTTLAEMIEKQGGSTCPLCQSRLGVCLDHDHATGEPRGALCQPCNRVLHYFENKAWSKRAEVYLARKITGPAEVGIRSEGQEMGQGPSHGQ